MSNHQNLKSITVLDRDQKWNELSFTLGDEHYEHRLGKVTATFTVESITWYFGKEMVLVVLCNNDTNRKKMIEMNVKLLTCFEYELAEDDS